MRAVSDDSTLASPSWTCGRGFTELTERASSSLTGGPGDRHARVVNSRARTSAVLVLAGLATACSSSSAPFAGDDAGDDGSPARDATVDGAGDGGGEGGDAGTDSSVSPGADASEADASDAAKVESGPPPTVLASDVPNPSFLVTDGAFLYWTDFVVTDAGASLGRVMKLPVTGGTEVTLATEAGNPAGLAVDAVSVYWVDDQGALYAAPLVAAGDGGGGAPTTLATGVAASSIAADGQFVYVASGLGAGVARVPVDGGGAVTLATPDAGFAPAGLAIDTSNVYWPAPAGGAILAVPKSGGAIATLVSNVGAPAGGYVSGTSYQNVASDGTSLVWNRYPGNASPSGGVLSVAIALDGGAIPSLLYDAGAATPFSVVTDGVSVYFLTAGNAPALMRAPLDGGAATVLANDQFAAGITGDPGPTVAVDGVSVYWLSPPQILKTAK